MITLNSFLVILLASIEDTRRVDGYFVQVAVDGGEYSQYEVVDRDVPPFNSPPVKRSLSPDAALRLEKPGGALVTGLLGNTRMRRSVAVENTCLNYSDDTVNKAVSVEKGETIHLPCHSCHVKPSDRYKPMQWMKLNFSPNSEGKYRVHEVVPGLHADIRRNRITEALDHTLSIRKAKMSDAGSYFCRPPGNETLADEHFTFNELQLYIADQSDMQFFFHVDVVNMNFTDTIDVSSDSDIRPREPEVVQELNIEVSTRWHNWSSCSLCDAEGTRKRLGTCVVQKADPSRKVPNSYLNNVLTLSAHGVPCQSQFLAEFANEKWLNRSTEFQEEECSVACPPPKYPDRKKRSVMSQSEVETKSTSSSKLKLKLKKPTGSYLALVCPGASILVPSVWMNGSELMPIMAIMNLTRKRIRLDPVGNLHFSRTVLTDSGSYSCWVKRRQRITYYVEIYVDDSEARWTYFLYLCGSFVVDLVVFIFLTMVKHCGNWCKKKMGGKTKGGKKTKKETKDKKTPLKTDKKLPAKVDIKRSQEKIDAKKSPAKVDAKKSLTKVDTQKSSVEIDTKQSKVKVDVKNSQVKADTKKSPTKVDIKKSSVKVDTKTSSAKIDTNKSPAKIDTKKSQAKVDTKKSTVNVDTKKSPAKVDTKKAPAKLDAKKSSAKVDTKKSLAKVDTKKSPAKVDTKKPSAKIDTKKSQAKIDIKKSPAKVDTKKSPAKVDAKKSPAKKDAKKSPAKVDTKKSPAKVDTKKSSAKADTKKSPG